MAAVAARMPATEIEANRTNVIGLLLSCSVRDPRLTSIFSGLCVHTSTCLPVEIDVERQKSILAE